MKYVKHIATIVLSLYLILAMSGLGIFHHLCSCSLDSKSKTSLIVEQNCCSQTNSLNEICHSAAEANTCGADECNDCNCETEVEVLTIDETLIAESIRINPDLSNHVMVVLFAIHSQLEITEKLASSGNPIDTKAPPKSGKEINIFFQSLKIPHHIS